ncbi:MAG: HAD family hydrolase [Betaproteobacteria bacterium]|nr:HAD family hydrolase [Betaproteobacteria bacterium]
MNLALFDLDYTLLNGDSDYAWGQFLVEEGVVDGVEFKRRNDGFWAQYKAGTLDIREYLEFALTPLAGKSPAEMKPLHDRYMARKIEPMIGDAARDLVARHRHDLCAIVTATNSFVTTPIAERFGIARLIGCDVEVVDGKFTGKPAGLPSFREGKITRVEQWLAGMGKKIADFDRSYFYSDSLNDLPMLKIVSHPVAVNPDATLREHAETCGWPIMQLSN